jgi:hypothetical protein
MKNRPKSHPTMFLLDLLYIWAIFSRKNFAQRHKKSPNWRNFAQSGHPERKWNAIAAGDNAQAVPAFAVNFKLGRLDRKRRK